jgi:hypothetical protein
MDVLTVLLQAQPSTGTIVWNGAVPGYAVGWGTLALINAGLAQGKGRSGLAWFLVSILLGPIATFLIDILPRVPASLP